MAKVDLNKRIAKKIEKVVSKALMVRSFDAELPSGIEELPFEGHSLTLVGGKLLCFGGTWRYEKYSDVLFLLDISTRSWSKVSVGETALPAIVFHRANLVKDRVVLMGGKSIPIEPFPAVWSYDFVMNELEVWRTDGFGPEALAEYSADYVEDQNEIVVFGGFAKVGVSSNTVFAFSVVSKQWCMPIVKGVHPRARSRHSSCTHGGLVYIAGGINTATKAIFSDLHVLDTRRKVYHWSKPQFGGSFGPGRYRAIMHYFQGHILLFGGNAMEGDQRSGAISDMSVLSLSEQRYYEVNHLESRSEEVGMSSDFEVIGDIEEETAHASVVLGDQILVMGVRGSFFFSPVAG